MTTMGEVPNAFLLEWARALVKRDPAFLEAAEPVAPQEAAHLE